jgi:hypothetical protein
VANVVSTGLDNAMIPYRSVEPVKTGAEFANADGEPMDVDENDSQGNNSDTGNNSSSQQTSESTDGAASDTKEAWPWATGLTHDGKRIMAYRTHGKAILEIKQAACKRLLVCLVACMSKQASSSDRDLQASQVEDLCLLGCLIGA